MTIDQAQQILIANRPDRPKSTDRRKLQKAVDIILEALDNRHLARWEICDSEYLKCSYCHKLTKYSNEDEIKEFHYCYNCGAYMGALGDD
jgi:hypothetical protein